MGHRTPLGCLSKCWIVQLTPRHSKQKTRSPYFQQAPQVVIMSNDIWEPQVEVPVILRAFKSPKTQDQDWQAGLCQLPQSPKNRPHSGSSGPCGISQPGIRSLSASRGGTTSSSRHQGTKRPNNIQGKGNCLQQNVSKKALRFHILK